MKARATLKNVDSESCNYTIVRNLSRILDIRIIEVDVEDGHLHFIYSGQKAFDQVKNELSRIGHPILEYTDERTGIMENITRTLGNSSIFIGRSRKPQLAMDR